MRFLKSKLKCWETVFRFPQVFVSIYNIYILYIGWLGPVCLETISRFSRKYGNI